MRIPIISAVAVVALTAGCVTQHPQTAEEFRQAVPGASFATVETFEVNRAFRDVARTFKQKGPQCLHGTVRTTSQTSTSYQVIVAEYNPTVVVTEKRAELHLQRHYVQGAMHVTEEPKGGYYLLVADAYPAGRNKTRIQIFRPSIGFAPLFQAIRNWASGKNLGCPDMAKF
jgi:hypothetical protein